MNKIVIFAALMIMFVLVACSSGNEAGNSTGEETSASSEVVAAAPQPATGGLTDSYDDALSVAGQLAIGTLQLEETPLAVDETQAAELLPLWQAMQTLSRSDTTAAAELDAVARQIEETMKPDQIVAIAEMALTNASVTELHESGALGFGGRGERAQAGGQLLPGGLPPGDLPGGGQGRGPGGGIGGFGGGEIDEDARATRQAELDSGSGTAQNFVYTNAVVRLLQTKTGEAPGNERAALFTELYNTVSEATGLTVEELQTRLVEGQTLSEIIEESGTDVAAVREAVFVALSALPEVEGLGDFDLDEFVDGWFGP